MNASTPHDVVGKLPTAREGRGRVQQGSGQDEESVPSPSGAAPQRYYRLYQT